MAMLLYDVFAQSRDITMTSNYWALHALTAAAAAMSCLSDGRRHGFQASRGEARRGEAWGTHCDVCSQYSCSLMSRRITVNCARDARHNPQTHSWHHVSSPATLPPGLCAFVFYLFFAEHATLTHQCPETSKYSWLLWSCTQDVECVASGLNVIKVHKFDSNNARYV